MNDEPTHHNNASNEHSEQAPTQPMADQQLKISTRERKPSQRYRSYEYMIMTKGGEP